MIFTQPAGTLYRAWTNNNSFLFMSTSNGNGKTEVTCVSQRRDGLDTLRMGNGINTIAEIQLKTEKLKEHRQLYQRWKSAMEQLGKLDFYSIPSVPYNSSNVSDGSSADYYTLPQGATVLNDLIQHKNMNHALGELFCAAYRYGQSSHSDKLRDAKKIKFYIEAEIKRLESCQSS